MSGQKITTTKIADQTVTPSTTAELIAGTSIYNPAEGDYHGFTTGAVVSLSSSVYPDQELIITEVEETEVTFTTAFSAVEDDILTKNYTGPHGTENENRRKRVLGYI